MLKDIWVLCGCTRAHRERAEGEVLPKYPEGSNRGDDKPAADSFRR